MADLVNIRQRIKSIETIKKITSAMRLISMSNHNKIKEKKEHINNYIQNLNNIYNILDKITNYKENIDNNYNNVELIILISSSKGLCGSFNNNIIKFFEKDIKNKDINNCEFIAIGTYSINFLYEFLYNHKNKIVKKYKEININNINNISNDIKDKIIQNSYKNVEIYYNYPKSFFKQIPYKLDILNNNKINNNNNTNHKEYIFEENPKDIINKIKNWIILTKIENSIFESILAEQAARFISMDNANNNAKKILEKIKLEYHKLRQSKITKEITELSNI